jgi:hypothetical protein
MVVEELARNSPIDLKTLSQVLGLRREILQSRQRFVLGPGGNVSPFLVLLVALTIPHTDIVKLSGQYAPWATQLTAGPAGWIALGALLLSFVFARFRALDVDETYSIQIGLVASALERTRTSQASTIASIEVPPCTLTGQVDPGAHEQAIAQIPAQESTNSLTEDHESYIPLAAPSPAEPTRPSAARQRRTRVVPQPNPPGTPSPSATCDKSATAICRTSAVAVLDPLS